MNITCVMLTTSQGFNVTDLAKRFAEVVIVLDASTAAPKVSTDGDCRVVRASRPLRNDFAAQRNYALSLCTQPWILFVDDDESVSDALARELESKAQQHDQVGFLIRRIDTFMGKQLQYGETGNMWLLRFAKRNAGSWSRPVHEVWQVEGDVGRLSAPLYHTPHASVHTFMDKIILYTAIEAAYRKQHGKRFSWFELILFPKAKFFVNYVLKLGFLDGFPGLVMAYMMSIHSLCVRINMYEYT